jgi:predicted Fe-Mo cluster-binding NifX family protein
MIDNTTLKIAVVTDDGSTIHRHFGRAQYYVIYTIEDGKVLSKQQVDKPHHHNHGHHHHEPNVTQVGADHDHHHDADRHRDMFQPLHGCKVLLTRGMGRGAFNGLQHIQVEPIITSIGDIDAAIQAYLTGQLDNHLEKLH